ncbi:MAG: hypothetical protein MUC49_10565 [Raineya sp.]|jgi:hypothetical protein|nr:hypothetical protein [Raineya sp.]
MKKILATAILSFSLYACGGDADVSDVKQSDSTSKNQSSKAAISPEVIKSFVDKIPSPMVISSLIKEMGVEYDQGLLNSIDNESKYNNDYRRALNLGIYSTDLGYANIYEKTQDATNLLVGVKDMADALAIGQYFEFEKIKELAKSSDKLDELLRVTEENLQEVNNRLQSNNRSDMTVLIITGGWVEVMYLACNVAKKKRNKDLETTIADQKVVLKQLVELLNYYDSTPKMKALHDELVELEKMFGEIKITLVKGEDKTEAKSETMVVEQGDREEAEMTQENLDKITTKISAIRNKIVN